MCNLLHLSGGSQTHSSNHRQAVCLGCRAKQAEGYPGVNTASWVSPLTQSVWFEDYDPARGYIWDCSVSSVVRASKILKQGEPKKRFWVKRLPSKPASLRWPLIPDYLPFPGEDKVMAINVPWKWSSQGYLLQRDLCQVCTGFPNLVWLGNVNSINCRRDKDGRIWVCLEISSVVIHSHRLWLFGAKSSQILKIPKDGDLAGFSGHLFQHLTNLILKKNTSVYPVRTSPAASCDLSLFLSPCTSGNRNCTTISQPCVSLREKAENFLKIYSGK